jgi:hypothetical protein
VTVSLTDYRSTDRQTEKERERERDRIVILSFFVWRQILQPDIKVIGEASETTAAASRV